MSETPGVTDDYLPMDAKRLLERLHTALNSKDVENLVRCFQVDYESSQPAQPDQTTTGVSGMADIWRTVFQTTPGFRADLLRSSLEGSEVWSEWRWFDAEEDGMDVRGVIIFGVENGLFAWSRVYMAPVQKGSSRPEMPDFSM